MYVNMCGVVMREVTSCVSGGGGKGPGTDARSGLSVSWHTWLLNLMVITALRWLATGTGITWQDGRLRESESEGNDNFTSEIGGFVMETYLCLSSSVSLSLLPSCCLCSLKICLRNSTLNSRRLQTRSSPSREQHSLMWLNTCGRIKSPTAWSTPYLLWVCALYGSRRKKKWWKLPTINVIVSNEFSVHRATGLWKDSRWTVRASPRSCLVSPLFQPLAWWPGSRPSLRRPGRLAGHALCSHPSGACCVPLTLLRERWAIYPLLTLDMTPKRISCRYVVNNFV